MTDEDAEELRLLLSHMLAELEFAIEISEEAGLHTLSSRLKAAQENARNELEKRNSTASTMHQ